MTCLSASAIAFAISLATLLSLTTSYKRTASLVPKSAALFKFMSRNASTGVTGLASDSAGEAEDGLASGSGGGDRTPMRNVRGGERLRRRGGGLGGSGLGGYWYCLGIGVRGAGGYGAIDARSGLGGYWYCLGIGVRGRGGDVAIDARSRGRRKKLRVTTDAGEPKWLQRRLTGRRCPGGKRESLPWFLIVSSRPGAFAPPDGGARSAVIFAPRWAVGRRRRSQTDDDDNDDDDGDGGDDDNICPLMTAMRHATMTTFICPLPQFVSLAVPALPLEV